jgi:RNA polymerase sigma-54 factor
MKLDAQLVQRPEQRLALLPQMLQSIEVLQMATTELIARIDAELQHNEALEVVRPADPEGAVRCARRRGPDGPDGKLALLHSVPAPETSLLGFVREQVAWRDLAPELAAAVLLLAEHLDERGLLPFSDDELAAMTGLAEGLLADAVAVLRSLEPRGIGARGAVEAMLLQVAGQPEEADIRELLTRHLEALAHSRVAEVARAMQRSVESVRRLLERVRTLDPRPGATFASRPEPAIRPDARVWQEGDEIAVAVDDSAMPMLRVNRRYEAMLRDRGTEIRVRDYLRGKVRSARDLIDAIANRRRTLARVVGALARGQPEFLAAGRAGIRPMRMAEVARTLGLHTSTVSRAIAGKYVQTDHGVLRLRDFFDGGSGGAEAAGSGKMAVRQAIQDLVAAEDPSRPLSDEDLVAALGARGTQVARRTVTKYRKELAIPSSFLRRREDT